MGQYREGEKGKDDEGEQEMGSGKDITQKKKIVPYVRVGPM